MVTVMHTGKSNTTRKGSVNRKVLVMIVVAVVIAVVVVAIITVLSVWVIVVRH